jgi:hypothetical protein
MLTTSSIISTSAISIGPSLAELGKPPAPDTAGYQLSSIRQPVRRAIERQHAWTGRRIRNEMQEYAYSQVFQSVKSAKLASLEREIAADEQPLTPPQ